MTKEFCQVYLDHYRDRRLIEQMEACGRSITANISEGRSRNQTKNYIEFLKFSLASLIELLEDYFELEREYKGGLRKTKGSELEEISKIIKLLMSEKTMLLRQIESLENKYIDFGDQKEDLVFKHNQNIKRKIIGNLPY